jgi:hypothetical protein
MAMVCPQCNGTFEQRLQCPNCSVRLLYQASSRRRDAGGLAPDDSWQQTPWGRIIVGLLLAQGIFYVLHELLKAGFLAAGEEGAAIWHTLAGQLILQALQAIGVLTAGILVGAGQRQGFVYGVVLGIWNGVLFILVQAWSGQPLTVTTLLGQPILQAAVGLAGGLAGSIVWRPLPQLLLPSGPRSRVLQPVRRKTRQFTGPVAWARVLGGTAVGVGGVIWANVILEYVLHASEGKLNLDSQLQAQLVTWEICALALFSGACLAGSNQRNGMMQGLCVGAGAGSILMGFGLASATVPAHLLMFTVTMAIPIGILGGWFGGQLLPPLVRVKRLKSAA